MKKLIYLTLLLLIVFSSCSKNDTPVIIDSNITEEDFLGTWELYYSSNATMRNPDNSNPTIYPAYRDTRYDGFKTEFSKENGVYKYRSINLLDVVADYGTYSYDKDKKAIIFDGIAKGSQGQDSAFQNIAKITETDFNGGILKMYQSYDKISNNQPFRITQAQAFRHTVKGAGKHPGVSKVSLDFSKLTGGRWDFENLEYWRDGNLIQTESQLITDSLKGYSLTFFYDGGQRCLERSYIHSTNTWLEYTFEVFIVDDIIYMPYKDPELEEPEAYAFWIGTIETGTDPLTGEETGVKLTINMQGRPDRDLSQMVRTTQYYVKNRIEE